MDDLDRREAFLLAIFAAPDDDLPRLVFADYLDERGESEWADLIRRECQASPASDPASPTRRGFRTHATIDVPALVLADPEGFRRTAIREHPEWYGCTKLAVSAGLIASSKPVGTILRSPVTQRVTRLDLSGGVVDSFGVGDGPEGADLRTGEYDLRLVEFTYRPTVTLQAVEALVNARECRRFTHLDLRNNDLDNDAARVILRSTNLTRLQSLHLFDGNRLRGRTWAQLQERFGEEVVQ